MINHHFLNSLRKNIELKNDSLAKKRASWIKKKSLLL
jgi:hypothetical protein